MTASPSAPVESDTITLGATVRNTGAVASPATKVDLLLGGSKAATASLGALAMRRADHRQRLRRYA